MPAKYIKDILITKNGINNLNIISQYMLSFRYEPESKEYTAYTPESSEYLVSSDVVTKAINLGANLIICEPWCTVTGEGYKTGANDSVSVYPLKAFLAKIYNGEHL